MQTAPAPGGTPGRDDHSTRITGERDNGFQLVYIFRRGASEVLAVTADKEGRNLPRARPSQRWIKVCGFRLGMHYVVPASIAAEPILMGLSQKGYFVWRERRQARHHRRLTLRPSSQASAAETWVAWWQRLIPVRLKEAFFP